MAACVCRIVVVVAAAAAAPWTVECPAVLQDKITDDRMWKIENQQRTRVVVGIEVIARKRRDGVELRNSMGDSRNTKGIESMPA